MGECDGHAPAGCGGQAGRGEEGIERVSLRRGHLAALKDILVRQLLVIL